MTPRPVERNPEDVFAAVTEAASGLPNVEASIRYDGAPVLKAAGCFMAGMTAHSSAEPQTLVARVDLDDRDALLEEAPDIYYLTDYHRSYPVVLVRLPRLGRDALRDLLSMSWRATMAKARSASRRRRGHNED